MESETSERPFGAIVDPIRERWRHPVTGKHPKTQPQERPRSDLDVDPGIGRSKGSTMAGEDPRDLDGGSTFQADVENQTNREGGVNPNRMGRTNK
jgi:hypothetical protein